MGFKVKGADGFALGLGLGVGGLGLFESRSLVWGTAWDIPLILAVIGILVPRLHSLFRTVIIGGHIPRSHGHKVLASR